MQLALQPIPDRSARPSSLPRFPRRILVFRALQLGDMLVSLPALRAIRAYAPDARITLAGLPWAAAFAGRYNRLLDDFVAFPGHPSLPEQPAAPDELARFQLEMRERKFDLAIQLHGSGVITNRLLAGVGARCEAGFYDTHETEQEADTFAPWPESGNEIERCLALPRFLGMPDMGDYLEFPLSQHDRTQAAVLMNRPGPDKPYICVHPGARMPSRRWPVERFAWVADALANEGFQIVLTGSADEAELTRQVREHMQNPVIDLAGKTSIGGAAAIVAQAQLVVTNDTGMSHVAAALATPSVVITLGSDPERWAPLDRSRHHVVMAPAACRPCMHQICPIGHPCAEQVSPEAVLTAASGLLAQYGRPDYITSGPLHLRQ